MTATRGLRRKRLPLAVALLLLVAGCGGDDDDDDATPTTPTSPSTSVDDRVRRSRELFAGLGDDDPHGCTAAVSRDGEVVWAEAFGGDLTVDTPVDIASTSKQFTATAVLLLELDLESALSEYVDGLPEWADHVTLRSVMHMQSGIPDYLGILDDDETTTNEDAVAALADVELEEPDYSNSNYVLLAEVVEAVTGEPFPTWVAANVFEPAGFDAVVEPVGPYQQYGDGSVRTTPSELVEWASQYWSPTVGPPDINDRRLENAEAYGAGIILEPDDPLGPLLWHDGAWDAITTFDLLPESRLAAAATCTDEDMPEAEEDNAYRLLEIWSA